MRDLHDAGHGGDDQEMAVVFMVYLIISRNISERPIIQHVLRTCGVPQLGVGLHVSRGTFHTHGLL
jgi:hypothetical protein